MTMSNYASSLGQKIGRTLENAVFRYLEPHINAASYSIRSESIENGDSVSYDIDLVVRNTDGDIISIMETKFIRYKKHNRDKGSWIANTHSTLRQHYPTIIGCYAFLGGNWSRPSLEMMNKKQVRTILIPFDHIADVYETHGVNIRWGEKEDDLKMVAYNAENRLTNAQRSDIGDEIRAHIQTELDGVLDSIIPDRPREL